MKNGALSVEIFQISAPKNVKSFPIFRPNSKLVRVKQIDHSFSRFENFQNVSSFRGNWIYLKTGLDINISIRSDFPTYMILILK